MPQMDPRIGEIYRHFKGKLYQVRELAKDADTGERLVVYQALYGSFETYVRRYDEFVGEVDFAKYPEVTVRFRFAWVPQGELAREGQRTDRLWDEGERQSGPASGVQRTDSTRGEDEPVRLRTLRDVSLRELMMAFLDERDFGEKDKILSEMRTRPDLDDGMIDNLAAALDVVIDEGTLDQRFGELRTCVQTRARFENTRLRA